MTAVTATADATWPTVLARAPRWLPTAVRRFLAVGSVAGAIGIVVLHVLNGPNPLTGFWIVNAGVSLMLVVPGALVARLKPRNSVGWLVLASGFGEAMCGLGREYGLRDLPASQTVGWFCDSLYVVSIALLPILLMVLPTGRPPDGWTRWLLAFPLLGVCIGVPSILLANDPDDAGNRYRMPFSSPVPQHVLEVLENVGFLLLVVLTTLSAILCLVLRFRRARGEERQQLKWIMYAGVLSTVEIFSENFIPVNVAQVTGTLSTLLFIVVGTMVVLRYRMLDIDLVINRTLVYLALTAGLIGVYVGGVALTTRAFGSGSRLAATVVVALAVAPGRQWLQRGVDRLLYGERRNPYGAMTRLGEQIGDAPADLTVLVATLTQVLKLPHAALVGPDGHVLAEVGRPSGEPVTQALEHRGRPLGVLVVSPRAGARFAADELTLLRDLSGQVAAALHAVQLSFELQESRRKLVTAKEEERRRLRNDLHDGLGPKLAALGLRLDAAGMLVPSRPEEAVAVVTAVKAEIRSTIEDIRRLVYDLRPPTLDELGLTGALQDCAQRLETGSGPLLTVSAVDLPDLPAAVEVAAFRIVTEAMTNAVRHAGARTCEVRLAVYDQLLFLEITDDGGGRPTHCRPGVGTLSMHERAAELGGALVISDGSPGTMVMAQLPVGGAA